MDWFAMLDRAKALGLEYALNGIAGGETAPEEHPLDSMEADRITVRDVVTELSGSADTYNGLEMFEIDDIASHWEDGYNSAPWPGN